MSVVPHRFLFRYAFPVPRVDALPRKGSPLLDLPESCTLPDLSSLDGAAAFGELRLGWNPQGVGVSARVRGKRGAGSGERRAGSKDPVGEKPGRVVPGSLHIDPKHPTESDGLQVWFDTRNTQSIHRAGRFCHHFCLLPDDPPAAVQLPIARAREDAPSTQAGKVQVACQWTADGYSLEAWFPAQTLHGYDPESFPQLGFYYHLRDSELGEQVLTVGREFPFAADPSLWSTLELTTG